MSNAHPTNGSIARVTASWNGRKWIDSSSAARDRMAVLVTRIDNMKAALLEQERAAFGLCDLTAVERVSYTRANIEIATAELLNEVKAMLARCSVHAEGALIAGCAECIAAADLRGGPAVPTAIREAAEPR